MKYRVGTIATTYVDLGVVEANNKEEAVEIAMERLGCDTISLCWECSRKVGELTISCDDEDIEIEEITD
jgi:phosphoribosyl-ATP pyrophosphohydrolase